jgi:hypothetical protein
MSNRNLRIGRVLRAGTRGFTIGCAVMQPDIPAFGSFVRADGLMPGSAIYGIEVSVLAVGVTVGRPPPAEGATIRHCLPAQPPVTLDWLYQCSDEEVRAFTARFDYFRLVLEAREAPADELLAASLRAAAAARPEGEQGAFLIEAGQELVRLLSGDPVRLEGLLRRLWT